MNTTITNNPGEISLENYFNIWMAARDGSVRDSTYNVQAAQFRTIAAYSSEKGDFGSLKLNEIGIQDIRSLQKALAEKYNSNTVNQYITLVKSILKSAVTERLIPYDPSVGVRKLRRTEYEARKTIHRALSRTETRQFFVAAQNSIYINLYRFLLNTGCRCGEAAAVKPEDIDEKVLFIDRTLTRTKSGGLMLGKDPKTSSGRRMVPLRKAALDAIKAQIEFNNRKYAGLCGSECIFRSPQGLLLCPSSVDANIRRICRAAGIEPFTSHAFRDTFATRAIESGMNPKTLQELLGHSDFSMTMNLYCHCMDSTKRREIDLIEI